MIILIDNYDSFSYNLYQLTGSIQPDILVVRNDRITIKELREKNPQAILLSPGPGKPADAGICMEVVAVLGSEIPILGVCLGHQAICQAYGGKVSYAPKLMHGKQSQIQVEADSVLFAGMPETLTVGRYHSLSAVEETLSPKLRVTARAEDGQIMAVEHRDFPVYGVQFHPESILTPKGEAMIQNFLTNSVRR